MSLVGAAEHRPVHRLPRRFGGSRKL